MNFVSYLEEVRFILTSIPTWSQKAELLGQTVAFHFANSLGRIRTKPSRLCLDVLIGGKLQSIVVRPNLGDLFILYEVLAREAYSIPAQRLDPQSVFTILDCGANIGLTSLFLAQRYRAARVVAVEPDPENYSTLVRNVAREDRIEPVQAAVVGGRSRPVRLSSNKLAYGNSITEFGLGGSGTTVIGLTVSEICRQRGIERVDLLKVDIEGAEQEVFADADFLPMVGAIAIELHSPYQVSQFRGDVAAFGFHVESPSIMGCRHAYLATPVA